ncbi:hypothetical protein G6F46_001339 [Rhizopus delemar]|uniref:Uncharacterized protein n=2 Tax=Rhizopus TaxID=4842 RepID=A0A9P6ZCL3_9FUNG|nr:hypothetical protein G6F43_002066 [Rhizopus delemar]KAG1548944.1 hypothetical protein G6F51_003358 [Rhizopus arrhizus]KAG1466064.1 hypothetical protein G6F55_000724 [Rhizopus delemar]KAG1505789.1 hypothetical protein G6F54_000054 [Rhizopus delemar]KAG1515656.1 hypothetical protein G6F53_002760 [Rhizopus delemar]
MAAFPILQWYYRDDVTKREAIPQLAYSAESVRSHFRFKRIINITRNMKSGGTAIVGKIGYFKDMNLFMTAILFLMSISLGILCVDGLTSGSTINSNKFATDLLTGNCDTCVIFLWVIGISIFHPRRSTDEVGVSTFSKSESHNHDIENKASSKFGTSFASNNDLHPSSNLSQRVANFIDNRNSGPAQTSNQFLRPMSPMEVDYPTVSVPNNKFVLTPNSKRYNMQPTSVSSEAPPSSKSQDYPMQTISGAAVAAVATGGHDFGFHPIIDKNSNEYDYLRTESNWARRPSFK